MGMSDCTCWDKTPTVPVFRDRNEHLPDCPAKDSGKPVGATGRPAWIRAAANECAMGVLVGDGERSFAEIIERHFARRNDVMDERTDREGDDDEPIDPGWMSAMGWRFDGGYWIRLPNTSVDLFLWCDTGALHVVVRQTPIRIGGGITTRGHVRRLLAALGIPPDTPNED
jgi:hypothetical protein